MSNANPNRGSAPRRRDTAGFSLAEVMVALIVFLVGALGLGVGGPGASRNPTFAGQQTRASEIASGTVDRLLATPFDSADLASGDHADPSNPYPGGYHATWSVEDDQPIALCKRITVTVRWPASNSTNRVRLVAVTPKSNQ